MANPIKRNQWSDKEKQIVKSRYPLAHTREAKIELANDLGMHDPENNLHKLYNIASRVGATGIINPEVKKEEKKTNIIRKPLNNNDLNF